MGNECCHLSLPQLSRVALAMKDNEPSNPGDVRLLGPAAVVSDSNRLPDTLE
jgi:hypothetical protein